MFQFIKTRWYIVFCAVVAFLFGLSAATGWNRQVMSVTAGVCLAWAILYVLNVLSNVLKGDTEHA